MRWFNNNSTPLTSFCLKCVMPMLFKQIKPIVSKKHRMIESRFSLLLKVI